MYGDIIELCMEYRKLKERCEQKCNARGYCTWYNDRETFANSILKPTGSKKWRFIQVGNRRDDTSLYRTCERMAHNKQDSFVRKVQRLREKMERRKNAIPKDEILKRCGGQIEDMLRKAFDV